MITFIAFLFTIAGSINWLLIGLLQYDYIAGFFGFQAALMSRIFYVLFGIGAVYLVLRVIINKGTFKIWERRKKKQKEEEKSLEKEGKQTPPAFRENFQPAYANIEASNEQIPQSPAQSNDNISQNQSTSRAQFVDFGKLKEFQNTQNSGNGNQNSEKPNFESEDFSNSPQNSNSSAPENFFEPPQSAPSSDTLFDEHIKLRK